MGNFEQELIRKQILQADISKFDYISVMKSISITILISAMSILGRVDPCSNYTCDSLAVRAILDSNGLYDNHFNSISLKVTNGRIDTLSLDNLDLTILPPDIGKLNTLKRLGLVANLLTGLPPEIGQLTALKQLNLVNNKLTSLPPEIGLLQSLEHLSLILNKLNTLPSEIGQLTNLKEINLFQNQLISVPPEIGQLSALQVLDLASNRLTALPRETWKLTSLTELGLYGNNLSNLPPEIGQLKNLKELSLVYNNLTSLPPEIGQLVSLEYLGLSENKLVTLPPEVGNLTALKKLVLPGNQLSSLPTEILNLEPSSIMDVNHNRLCKLPDSIEAWIDEFHGHLYNGIDINWRENQNCDTEINIAQSHKTRPSLTIHHDPLSNSITISFPEPSVTRVLNIYTTKGKLIKKYEICKNPITWNTKSHERGVYYLRALIDGANVLKKLVL